MKRKLIVRDPERKRIWISRPLLLRRGLFKCYAWYGEERCFESYVTDAP